MHELGILIETTETVPLLSLANFQADSSLILLFKEASDCEGTVRPRNGSSA
jgi:hypothetical protein